MAQLLNGCNAKLTRADEHLKSLQAELRAWYALKPYAITNRTDADFRRHSIVVNFTRPFPRDRFAIITGDVIHSLRCALDHLVYAVACNQGGIIPPKAETSLAFPIADKDEWFDAAISKGRLTGVSANVQSLIRSFQPAHRKHPQLRPLLGMLRDMDDTNKHRFLSVVTTGNVEGNLTSPVLVPAGQSVHIEFHEGPIEDGSEAVTLISPIPQPDFKLGMGLRFAVGLEHPAGPSGAAINGLFVVCTMLRDEVRFVMESIATEVATTHPW